MQEEKMIDRQTDINWNETGNLHKSKTSSQAIMTIIPLFH